ncbi:hypothetical protein F503_05315 [Ophiostoma piceae UAMH 11346]|uniref:Uncharacterized protein n=1 Tax=Ophiostoma piceae (strain UAMH 11346) TaxID=1262450 RepID=S3D9Q7_OPHP1|nr:hypothetical protein F503_05315 [Ophiostoma piceae UAMH 11346]
MVTVSATVAAYIFLPGHIYLIYPVATYTSLPAWILSRLRLQHVPAILCVSIILSWAGTSVSYIAPVVNDLKTCLEDAVVFPYETIVEPFIEAFHNGLSTIEFHEGLARDKEELAYFWPIATKLITSLPTVYWGAVESQKNVRANVVDAPERFFDLHFESLEKFFLANMRIVLIAPVLIIAYNWATSRSGYTNNIDLGQQRTANAELMELVEAQNAQVQATDAHVCAIHASCEALLSLIWVNVFCPGARRHIQVLELENIPRSLPHREPRVSRDVMFSLRHRLGVRPGLNMPMPDQIESYDPIKKHIALEAIRGENLILLETLAEEERTLLALRPRLGQLEQSIKRDATNGHPNGRRGFITWTPADAEPDLQRYSEYLALKQQDPTAPHLETFQMYEFYLASGRPHQFQASPLSPVSSVSSVYSVSSVSLVHTEPVSPTAAFLRVSEGIESRWQNVQRGFCNVGQSPFPSIYNRGGRYTFPEPQVPVLEPEPRVARAPEKIVRSFRKNVPQDGNSRPGNRTESWKKRTTQQAVNDEERAMSAAPEPPQTPSKAPAPPTGPANAEVEVKAAPAPPAAANQLEYREAHVVDEESLAEPSSPSLKSQDRQSLNDGRALAAALVDQDPAAAEPKKQELMHAANVDYFNDALAAFAGLRLEDLPPLPPSPTVPDVPPPPLPPFPAAKPPKRSPKPARRRKAVRWDDVLEKHAIFQRHDPADTFIDTSELQRRREAVDAIIKSLFSSIPQHIRLDHWPARYLPRRLTKAKYGKSRTLERFRKRVERTWTHRVRGGRRIETMPTPVETSADAFELTRNSYVEGLADASTPSDAQLSVKAVVDTTVTSTAEADAKSSIATSAGPSNTPALDSSTAATEDPPEESLKELWVELFGVSPDSSNCGETEEPIVHESQVPESEFTFSFPMPISDAPARQHNLPPLFLPSTPPTAATLPESRTTPVTTQSNLPPLYLPSEPSLAVVSDTGPTTLADNLPVALAAVESNAGTEAIPEDHQDAEFTFDFQLPTTNPFANQSNVHVDQLPAPSQPVAENQPELASTGAAGDVPVDSSAAESQILETEAQPADAQGAGMDPEDLEQLLQELGLDDHEQTAPEADAYTESSIVGDQSELLESALAALDIACDPANRYAVVNEGGGQGGGQGDDANATSIIDSMMTMDLNDTDMFPPGYFDTSNVFATTDQTEATDTETANIGATDVRTRDVADPGFSAHSLGASNVDDIDTGVFDYGSANDFDIGAFDFGNIGTFDLGAFDFPDTDAADAGVATSSDTDNNAAIVADAVADLNSQPDLFPLSMFLDTSRYDSNNAGEYGYGELHGNSIPYAGTSEAPAGNLELQNSELLSTEDFDPEDVAAFEAATGLAGQTDAEIDNIFEGIDQPAPLVSGLQTEADASVSEDSGDFDAEAVAAFGLAAGLTGDADAELANIFEDVDLPAPAQLEEPAPGVPGESNAEGVVEVDLATALLGQTDPGLVYMYNGLDLTWPHDPDMMAALGMPVEEDWGHFDAEGVEEFGLEMGFGGAGGDELDNFFDGLDNTNDQSEAVEAAATTTAGPEDTNRVLVPHQDEDAEEGDLSSLSGGDDEYTEGDSHAPANEAADAAATPPQDVTATEDQPEVSRGSDESMMDIYSASSSSSDPDPA